MSLKYFHIIFITLATLLSFGYGVWSVVYCRNSGLKIYCVLGVLAFLVGGLLIIYGKRFFKKLILLND